MENTGNKVRTGEQLVNETRLVASRQRAERAALDAAAGEYFDDFPSDAATTAKFDNSRLWALHHGIAHDFSDHDLRVSDDDVARSLEAAWALSRSELPESSKREGRRAAEKKPTPNWVSRHYGGKPGWVVLQALAAHGTVCDDFLNPEDVAYSYFGKAVSNILQVEEHQLAERIAEVAGGGAS